MARCPHKFELTVVRCPQCPGAPPPKRLQNVRNNIEDITGRTMAGGLVLARAENKAGSVAWTIQLACGHTRTIAGSHLRQQHKLGGKVRCLVGCPMRRAT